MFSFGRKSSEVRATAHPVLQRLLDRVVRYTDITLLKAHRSKEEQNQAFADQVSSKKWPESKHNSMPSMAVDLAPWPIPEGWGGLKGQTLHARDLDWKERVKFYEVLSVVQHEWVAMCEEEPGLAEQYRLRMGKDWDGDGDYRDQGFDDLPHIELVEL